MRDLLLLRRAREPDPAPPGQWLQPEDDVAVLAAPARLPHELLFDLERLEDVSSYMKLLVR